METILIFGLVAVLLHYGLDASWLAVVLISTSVWLLTQIVRFRRERETSHRDG